MIYRPIPALCCAVAAAVAVESPCATPLGGGLVAQSAFPTLPFSDTGWLDAIMRSAYNKWCNSFDRVTLLRHYNPLPILARAVNSLRLVGRIIFQPRWKAGRYKSKT